MPNKQIQTKKRLQALKADGDNYRLTFRDRTVVDADYAIFAIARKLATKVLTAKVSVAK